MVKCLGSGVPDIHNNRHTVKKQFGTAVDKETTLTIVLTQEMTGGLYFVDFTSLCHLTSSFVPVIIISITRGHLTIKRKYGL